MSVVDNEKSCSTFSLMKHISRDITLSLDVVLILLDFNWTVQVCMCSGECEMKMKWFCVSDKPHHQNTSISNSSNSLISNFNNNNSCEVGGAGLHRQNLPNHNTASASSFASMNNNSANVAVSSSPSATMAIANGNYQKLISTTLDAKLSRADLDYLAAPKFAPVVSTVGGGGQSSQSRRQLAGSTGDSMPPPGVPIYPDNGGSYGSRDPSPDPDNLSQNLSDSRDEVFVDDVDYGMGACDVTTVEARVHVRNKSNISYDDINMQPMLKDSLQTRARKKSASKTTDRPRNGKDYGIPPTRGFSYRSADSFSRYSNLKNVSPEQTQQRRNSCKHEYVNAECIDNVFHIRKEQRGMHNNAEGHKYSTDSSMHSSNSDLPRTSFSPGRDQLGRKKPPYENMMAPNMASNHKKLSSNSAGPTVGSSNVSSVHNGGPTAAGSESIYHSINYNNGKKRGDTMSHRSAGRFFEDGGGGIPVPTTPHSKVHLNYIDLSPANAMPTNKSTNSSGITGSSTGKNMGGVMCSSASVKPQVSREARTVQYCAIDVESTNILHRCFEEHAKGRKEIYDRQHRPPLASSNKTAENRHNSNSSAGSGGSLPRYSFR